MTLFTQRTTQTWTHTSCRAICPTIANIINVKVSRIQFSLFEIFAVIIVVLFIAWQTFVIVATFFYYRLQVGVLPLSMTSCCCSH